MLTLPHLPRDSVDTPTSKFKVLENTLHLTKLHGGPQRLYTVQTAVDWITSYDNDKVTSSQAKVTKVKVTNTQHLRLGVLRCRLQLQT